MGTSWGSRRPHLLPATSQERNLSRFRLVALLSGFAVVLSLLTAPPLRANAEESTTEQTAACLNDVLIPPNEVQPELLSKLSGLLESDDPGELDNVLTLKIADQTFQHRSMDGGDFGTLAAGNSGTFFLSDFEGFLSLDFYVNESDKALCSTWDTMELIYTPAEPEGSHQSVPLYLLDVGEEIGQALWGIPAQDLPGVATVDIIVQDPDVLLGELVYASSVRLALDQGLEEDDFLLDVLNPLQLLVLGPALHPENGLISYDEEEVPEFQAVEEEVRQRADDLYNALFTFSFAGNRVESALVEPVESLIGGKDPEPGFILQLNPDFNPGMSADPSAGNIADALFTDVDGKKALRFVFVNVDNFSNPTAAISIRDSFAELDNFIAIEEATLPLGEDQSRPTGLILGRYIAFDTAPVAQLDRWEILLELPESQIEALGADQRLKDLLGDVDLNGLSGRERLESFLDQRAEFRMALIMLDFEIDVLQSLGLGERPHPVLGESLQQRLYWGALKDLLHVCDTTCETGLDVLNDIVDGENISEEDFIDARDDIGDAIIHNIEVALGVDAFLNDVFVFEGVSDGEKADIASQLSVVFLDLLFAIDFLGRNFFENQDLIAEGTLNDVAEILGLSGNGENIGELCDTKTNDFCKWASSEPLGITSLDKDCGDGSETPCTLSFTGSGGFAVEDISLTVSLPESSPLVATQDGDFLPPTFDELEFPGVSVLGFMFLPSNDDPLQWNPERFFDQFSDRSLELFDLTTANAIRMVLSDPPVLNGAAVLIELDDDQWQAVSLRLGEAIDSVEAFFDWLDDTESNFGVGLGARLEAADELLNEHLQVTLRLVGDDGNTVEEKVGWNLSGVYQEALESPPGSSINHLETLLAAVRDGDPQLLSVELFDASPDDGLPARLGLNVALPANQADAEVLVSIKLTSQIIIEPALQKTTNSTVNVGDDIPFSIRILEFSSSSSVILGELEWSTLKLRLDGDDALVVLDPLREALAESKAMYEYLREIAAGPVDELSPFVTFSNLEWIDSVLNGFFTVSEGDTNWVSGLDDFFHRLTDENNDVADVLSKASPLFFLTEVSDTGDANPGASLELVFVNQTGTTTSNPAVELNIAGETTTVDGLEWSGSPPQVTWLFRQMNQEATKNVTPNIPGAFTGIVQGGLLLGPEALQLLEDDLRHAMEAGAKFIELLDKQDEVTQQDIEDIMPLFIEADAALANTLAFTYSSGEKFTLNLEAQARHLIDQLDKNAAQQGLMGGSLLVIHVEILDQTRLLPNGDEIAATVMLGLTEVPSLEAPTLLLTVGGQQSEGVNFASGIELSRDNGMIFQTFTWLVTGLPLASSPGMGQSGQTSGNTTSPAQRLNGDLTEAVVQILADTVPPLLTSSRLDPSDIQPASMRATCTPLTPAPGDQVTCAIHGGKPGSSFTIRAVANPVLSEKVVTFNLFGSAMFTFHIPETIDQDTVRLEVLGLDSIELSSVLSSLTINREVTLVSPEETDITPVDEAATLSPQSGSLWPMALIALGLLLFLSILALLAQARHRRTGASF